MDNINKIQSRKKFIGAGISAAALFTAFKFFVPAKKKNTETVKMLTREGKLVQVDVQKLPGKGNKITNEQLKRWVNKNQKN